MKNEIIISANVIGTTASGKSTILSLFKEFLKEKGFEVDHIVNYDDKDEESFDEVMKQHLDAKIDAIKEKTKITIQEIQVYRQPIEKK